MATTPAVRLYETLARSTRFTDDIDEALELYGGETWQTLSGGEKASLAIALSLYGANITISLRQAFAVMDHHHAELCLDAMTETAGLS